MGRVSIQETAAGFALERDGVALAELTPDDVVAIANSAANHRQTAMAKAGLAANAVFATEVSSTELTWDALGENVLVKVATAPVGGTVFELDPIRFSELKRQVNGLGDPPAPSGSH